MAAAMGKDGYITWGGNTTTVAYIDSWSINPSIGTAEVTAYGDTAKSFISTLREWTVTCGGTLDMSDTDHTYVLNDFYGTATSTSFEVRLYDSTKYWTGSVLPVSATINSQVNDKVSFTLNFQGTGNLSYITT